MHTQTEQESNVTSHEHNTNQFNTDFFFSVTPRKNDKIYYKFHPTLHTLH